MYNQSSIGNRPNTFAGNSNAVNLQKLDALKIYLMENIKYSFRNYKLMNDDHESFARIIQTLIERVQAHCCHV